MEGCIRGGPENWDRNTPRMTFGCPVLDSKFGGGVRCRGITEVVAESGAGKTQLSLQLLLSAQLPKDQGGLDGSSIYLHTQKPFPLRRLEQMAENRPHLPINAMDRVFIMYINSVEHLIDVLLRIDTPVQSKNVKVIIIDSIAGLSRGLFYNTNVELALRKNYFYKIASLLKTLSHKYELAVVVTNQVVDVIPNEWNRLVSPKSLVTSGREVRPALGLIWGSCVDCRLFLKIEFDRQENRDGETNNRFTRKMIMEVIFAPYIRPAASEYMLTENSFKGILET